MLDKSYKFPRIIAYGMSPDEILHYYIEVEKELIDVSLFTKYYIFIYE